MTKIVGALLGDETEIIGNEEKEPVLEESDIEIDSDYHD